MHACPKLFIFELHKYRPEHNLKNKSEDLDIELLKL
jgi:hypothetical protein